MNFNKKLLTFLKFSECDDNAICMSSIANVVESALNTGMLIQVRSQFTPLRNKNYFEVIIPQYSLDDFYDHFRMSRSSFEKLHDIIREQLGDNGKVPLKKKLLFTLWFLAKQECFLSIGDRFGLALSTAHLIFIQIITEISNLKSTYIKFPSADRQLEISNEFKSQSGIPGIVRAIDGSHIQIKQPIGNAVDFYNRKSFHSVILQGICEHDLQFTDIYVGSPGRMHDARVFKKSTVYKKLINAEEPLLEDSFHLLGDTAYPNSTFLVTPFKQNGHLTAAQESFNVKISSLRSCIERAFALLKGKFIKLKYLDMSNHHRINETITAACVLHNFILQNENNAGFEFIEYLETDEDESGHDISGSDVQPSSNNKRNELLGLFGI